MQCETCGKETPVVRRFIGFFGLNETHSRWCRECLPAAATAAGLPPDDVVRDFDRCVEAVAAGRTEYEERKRRRSG